MWGRVRVDVSGGCGVVFYVWSVREEEDAEGAASGVETRVKERHLTEARFKDASLLLALKESKSRKDRSYML